MLSLNSLKDSFSQGYQPFMTELIHLTTDHLRNEVLEKGENAG